MKVLILGAGGQLGRALAAAAPAGVDVHRAGRGDCDITDPASIDAVIARIEPDLLFNAAAYTKVDKAEAEEEQAAVTNARAPGLIANAVRRAGGRTIHFSTDYVFDGKAGQPYRPEDVAAPLSAYGRTKLAGERAVAAAAPDALIIRSAWLYAPRGNNFLSAMLRAMRERGHVRVVDDQIGTPTRAESLADAAWALATRGAEGIHHFTDAGVASWYDFAVAIREEAAAIGLIAGDVIVEPVPGDAYPRAARRPAFSVLDKSLTWRAIGTTAPHWRINLRAVLNELCKSPAR